MEENGSRLDRIEHLIESLVKSGAETDRRLRSLGEQTDRRLEALGEQTDRRLEALGEHTDTRIKSLLEMMAQHETTQRSSHERIDEVFQGLESLVLALDRYAESTQIRINALAEAQNRTENNLNALISVVDGLVRRPPQ